MSRRGWIAVTIVAMAVLDSFGSAKGQSTCVVSAGYGPQSGATIGVSVGSGWEPGSNPSGVIEAGIQEWEIGCPGGGESYPQFMPGASSCDVSVSVHFAGGRAVDSCAGTWITFHPGGQQVASAEVTLYEQDASGRQCNYADTLAHELGHILGLQHSGCPGSMMGPPLMENGIYTGGRAVQSDECAEVQNAWTTPSEIVPPDEDTGIPHIPLEQGFGLDPLILDLNGDGIITTSLSWPVSFDLDGDGAASNMGWTNPSTEEGFLWIDLWPNGRVDDGRELFGTGTMMPSGELAPDGFQALAIYDRAAYGGNDDWWIDRSDKIWSRLRVWVDRNHDGISTQDEIAPIHAHGILGIDIRMSRSQPRRMDANGNIHMYELTFLRRDRNRILEGAIHCLTFAAPSP